LGKVLGADPLGGMRDARVPGRAVCTGVFGFSSGASGDVGIFDRSVLGLVVNDCGVAFRLACGASDEAGICDTSVEGLLFAAKDGLEGRAVDEAEGFINSGESLELEIVDTIVAGLEVAESFGVRELVAASLDRRTAWELSLEDIDSDFGRDVTLKEESGARVPTGIGTIGGSGLEVSNGDVVSGPSVIVVEAWDSIDDFLRFEGDAADCRAAGDVDEEPGVRPRVKRASLSLRLVGDDASLAFFGSGVGVSVALASRELRLGGGRLRTEGATGEGSSRVLGDVADEGLAIVSCGGG
jgi:hypothetical protein